jgi:phytoene dehydrogenase-like protein
VADDGFDAVIIGSGHNGLIAACYLARAGLKVCVLERREVLGGATVTEELLPGFRVSTASYSFSLFRPDIYRDLDLASHGLTFSPKDPQLFVPLPDGRHFFIWRDGDRTRSEIERIHPPDAEAHRRWGAWWEEAIALLRPLVEDPDPPSLPGVESYLRDLGREDVWRLAVAGSAAEVVEEFFESDELRGCYASQGIVGTWAGARDPGTAWVMAYHFIGGELLGETGTWAYVRGGMGGVSAALASAAESLGVSIRAAAPVSSLLVEGGHVAGVRLESGETVRSGVVLSNAHPVVTFTSLVPSGAIDAAFMDRVRSWQSPGCTVKVNLALEALPEFTALPGSGPQHFGTVEISPSVDYLQRAYLDARHGHASQQPWMEVFIQSATDPTLAPPGKHVLSAFTQYVPPEFTAVHRSQMLTNVLDTLAAYAPNIRDIVLKAEALGPTDLEARFGLAGGNIFHGEILPEQSFGERFEYRTPLAGLYLCGSGARPGGGVMGAAGRNAALNVLGDLRR